MIRLERLAFVALCAAVLGSSGFAQDLGAERYDNWHQWRGPDATGSVARGNPPTRWSESQNVQWKVPIEGAGSSTPIVWGDQVFVLTSVDTRERAGTAPRPEGRGGRFGGGGGCGGGGGLCRGCGGRNASCRPSSYRAFFHSHVGYRFRRSYV